MPAVASALFASGRLMVQNVRKKLAPSSVADLVQAFGDRHKAGFQHKDGHSHTGRQVNKVTPQMLS